MNTSMSSAIRSPRSLTSKVIAQKRKQALTRTALSLALCAAFPLAQAAGFEEVVPTVTGMPSYGNALSTDGSTSVGYAYDSNENQIAYQWRNGVFTYLGSLNQGGEGYQYSVARAVSSTGAVVVGRSYNGEDNHAFRWTAGKMQDLGTLAEGNWGSSDARSVSADGSVVVGSATTDSETTHAFRWTSAGMVDLGVIDTGYRSQANKVSADGNTVVGYSNGEGFSSHAFRWTTLDPVMRDLGTLGGPTSEAFDVSADGKVVVGDSTTIGYATHAFRWTEASGKMQDLGTLGGYSSNAKAVSADGSTVVGHSNLAMVSSDLSSASSNLTHAFRWTAGTGMQDLGSLSASKNSYATGVSANGSVVVGYASDSQYMYDAKPRSALQMGRDIGIEHFRWSSATGMQSVSQWLTNNGVTVGAWKFDGGQQQKDAGGVFVSADGNVVSGTGTNPDGTTRAYIARVTPTSSALIDPVAWIGTLNGTLEAQNNFDTLVRTPLEGAHHRPIMGYDKGLAGDNCFWATGDLGRFYSDRRNTTVDSAEVGACLDFAQKTVRVGAGIGYSGIRQKFDMTGHANVDGAYLVTEADWNPSNTNLLASLTGIYGRWSAQMRRGYLNGAALDASEGNTTFRGGYLRARLDWLNAATLAGVTLTPWGSVTVSRTLIDGYTETGGGIPAQFDGQVHTATEGRLGLTVGKALTPSTELRGTAEVVHRFDKNGPALTGQEASGLFSFNLPGQKNKQTWGRATIEVDQKLSKSSLISISLAGSTKGEAPDLSAAITYRMKF